MREILFKAKRIDNGEWVEGSIITRKDTQRVFMVDIDNTTALRSVTTNYCDRYDWRAVEVQKDTLCQYTGLTDKHGNKIWENDVVRYLDELINKVKEDLIVWHETYASFCRLHESKQGLQYLLINENISKDCEVIGNIFDNPELIKAGGVNG